MSSRQVAYDNGFSIEFSTCCIPRWSADIDKKVQVGVSSTLIVSNLYKKRINDVDKIENLNPRYLYFYTDMQSKQKGQKQYRNN